MSAGVEQQAQQTLRLGAVHLAVSDLNRSVEFYSGALGIPVISQGHEGAVLGASRERPLLQLTRLAHPTAGPLRSTGLFHVAFLHPSRAELAATVLRIANAGWPISGASDHGVSEAIYLNDPDGLGLELYADRPRAQWPAPEPGAAIGMFVAPLDMEDLLASAAPLGPIIAPATTVGHMHLKVADLGRSVRFYRDGLGLSVQAQAPDSAFLAADGYHHHIGLNTWRSLGAPAPPSSSPGLRLFEIQLNDVSAVDALEQRLEVQGDVHVQRDEESLALHDPDGHPLELIAVAADATAAR
jgi:catechol 2,3-dioxygenase